MELKNQTKSAKFILFAVNVSTIPYHFAVSVQCVMTHTGFSKNITENSSNQDHICQEMPNPIVGKEVNFVIVYCELNFRKIKTFCKTCVKHLRVHRQLLEEMNYTSVIKS